MRDLRIDLRDRTGVHEGVLLRSQQPDDVVTDRDAGVFGRDHDARGERAHHLADPHRGHVGAALVIQPRIAGSSDR